MISITKRIITVIAAVLMVACGFTFTAYADWYDDVSSGTYTEIKGDNFVAETFNGVDALYSDISSRYQCNELVMRYYEQVYGLDIIAYPGGIIMLSSGYEFVTPDYPHEGDIVFAPSKFRKNKSDHWAIVKSCENGKITLFEQNVVYNGKAGTGRTVKYPSGNYYVYTARKLSGSASDIVTAAVTEKTTATATTAATAVTENITDFVTEKKTDTVYTTINPTTAVYTTKVRTTVPKNTVKAEKETAKETEKLTEEPVTREADLSRKQTAENTESFYAYAMAEPAENGSETVTAVSDEYYSAAFETVPDAAQTIPEVQSVPYDDIKSNINKKPFIAAFAAVLAVSAAAVIAVILRKK